MKTLILLLALLTLGCVTPIPPIPTPTPPPPTPSPGPLPTPNPPPHNSEIIIFEGKASPPISGAVGCCNTPPIDASKGWTLVGQNETDAYRTIGNMGILRTGPYSDQGYGWSLIVSPTGPSRLRESCQYLNKSGLACLVEAGTDYWAMKPQNSQYNLYHDTCAVTHGTPPARYQRWTRAVVKEVGDLNVWWSLGNEGWLCNPSRDWYDGLVFVIRTAETDFGYHHHPIGNVWSVGAVGEPRYDFAEVHGSPDSEQPNIGIPVILTESDNEDPPESNDRWIAARQRAAATNGAYNVLMWRGSKADADWDSLFVSLGGRPMTRGLRKDTSCVWNAAGVAFQPVCKKGDAGCTIPDAIVLQQAEAVEKVIAYAPWLFTNGGNNLVYTRGPEDSYTLRDFFSINAAMLQPACTIVGDPTIPNSYDTVDNIELWPSSDSCLHSTTTFGIHEIVFGPEDNHFQVMRGSNVRGQFQGKTAWFTNPGSPCGTQTLTGPRH